MTQFDATITTIRPQAPNQAPNPLDLIVQNAARRLIALQMTRLYAQADKSDAQGLTRDLLDVGRIVDEMLLAIGREAKAHFGHDVDLTLFTDQLSSALEGGATWTICAAFESREEEIEAEIGDWQYKNRRDYAA